MLKEGMYVRCAIDDERYHREFAIGKIVSVNEFSEKVTVDFYDILGIGIFYTKPEKSDFSIESISRVKVQIGSKVKYKRSEYIVKAVKKNKNDEMYYYYLQSDDNQIISVAEKNIEAAFNNGDVSPLDQLLRYEFQNPMWFCGRSVVSKTMNIINNSLYGFSNIAGCKIYLKTHQLRTAIRCLQDGYCRNMIADEVGMGKTIEAAAVLKIYLHENHNSNVLIVVPDSLIAQWQTELAYKFKILEGLDVHNNNISLIGISEVDKYSNKKYDFIVVDEVHKYLQNAFLYKTLLELSRSTENIIMLSATPVQRRQEEYKKLLQLIQPEKYIEMTEQQFDELLELQGEIVRRVHSALENLDSYVEEIEDSDFERNEDTEDAFDDVIDSLEKIKKLIKDESFNSACQLIDYQKDDFGIEAIQTAIAYICENYQFEKSIIRNRRSEEDDDHNNRELVDISYEMQTYFNNTEYVVYKMFAEWFSDQKLDCGTFESKCKKLISAFFSSASAFYRAIMESDIKIPEEIRGMAEQWKNEEKKNIREISEYLNEPDTYSSRVNNIVDYIDQEGTGKKILVFTNFEDTFALYKEIFIKYFGNEHCTFFSKDMEPDFRELNAYRFETDKDYWILLSDESGGEGRNFQNADMVIHIDIPWSANDLEQRIGRLDRIGRDRNKAVISVVAYAKDSIEEDLFKFWSDGIGIFTKSQSGLEIIMNDMDEKIVKSVCEDFKYGLIGIVEEVEKEIQHLKEIITRERYFDLAEYKYQTINKIMEHTRDLYQANEKKLFGDSMMGWSALAGFHGKRIGEDILRFDVSSFSLKSAYNSLFVPPDMKLMISDRVNQIQNRVRKMNCERSVETDVNYVQGTFDRKLGLENDYIHFFAPGDPIFDSIVNNALGSYKGTCAAFAVMAPISWSGFVFTWSLRPDETFLYDNGVSSHAIDQYRGFMPVEQFQYAVSFDSDSQEPSEEVLKVFNHIVAIGATQKGKIKHLGSRSGSTPNIELFMNMYSPEKWTNYVKTRYEAALIEIKKEINAKMKKQLYLLKGELQRSSGAQRATQKYFGAHETNSNVQNEIIYKCFSNAKIKIDSACYVRMINEG